MSSTPSRIPLSNAPKPTTATPKSSMIPLSKGIKQTTTPATTPRSQTTTPTTTPRKQATTPATTPRSQTITPTTTPRKQATTPATTPRSQTTTPTTTPRKQTTTPTTTPRYAKQGSSINRSYGSKAVSQGTVTPTAVSKGGDGVGTGLNDRFKSANPIRSSIPSNMNGQRTPRSNISGMPGSGESAAMSRISPGLSIAKEGQKRPQIKKIVPVPDSQVPLNVLMSPKRIPAINHCISRSAFDKEGYETSQNIANFQEETACCCLHNDLPPVQAKSVDDSDLIKEETKPAVVAESIPAIPTKTKPHPEDIVLEKVPYKAKEKVFDTIKSDDPSVEKTLGHDGFATHNEVVVRQYENPNEDIDSIEEILPPAELHEVVSDPKFEESSSLKVESLVDMLESLEPPSLVESIEDLQTLRYEAVKVEIDADENPVDVDNNNLIVQHILLSTEESTITENPVPLNDTIQESKYLDHEPGNEKMYQDNFVDPPGGENSDFDVCTCIADAIDPQPKQTSEPLILQDCEVMDYPCEEFKGLEGTFQDEEINELTREYFNNLDNKQIIEITSKTEETGSRKVLKASKDSKKCTVKENISQLEKQFLPFMIEKGLRPGCTPLDCETTESQSQILDQTEREIPELYTMMPEGTNEFASAPANFRVHVPNAITMVNGVQPLTFSAEMIIRNRDSRLLTYQVKVLTTNRSRYAIKPCMGFLPVAGEVLINIQSFFTTFDEVREVAKDSFVILVAEATPETKLTRSALKEYWNLLKDRWFESVQIFKIEKVEIVDLPKLRDLANETTGDVMTDDDEYTIEEANIPSASDDLVLEAFSNSIEVTEDLRTIRKSVNEMVTIGCLSLYIGTTAVVAGLIYKNIESMVVPPETEPEGWFDWIPFFGKNSP